MKRVITDVFPDPASPRRTHLYLNREEEAGSALFKWGLFACTLNDG